MDGKEDGAPFRYQSLRRVTYTYPGDENATTAEPTLTKEALMGKWINENEHIEISLGGAAPFDNGIYSTDTLREDISEIMDVGSD